MIDMMPENIGCIHLGLVGYVKNSNV